MTLFFKVLGVLFSILFIWSAILQYNDPDPIQWIVYYGAAAMASILFVFNRLKLIWALLLFFFFLFKMYWTWPDKFEGLSIGEGDINNIERGREALGLGISAFAMLIYGCRLWYCKKLKI